MSFASETKKELTNLEMKECCEKAELSALLRMNGSLSFQTVVYQSIFKRKMRQLQEGFIRF